jgi:hypothetical protein
VRTATKLEEIMRSELGSIMAPFMGEINMRLVEEYRKAS